MVEVGEVSNYAQLRLRLCVTSWLDGREVPKIFSAAFFFCLSPCNSQSRWRYSWSTWSLWCLGRKWLKVEGESWAVLIQRRKSTSCWACLSREDVFCDQSRLSVNLMLLNTSIALLSMPSGEWLGCSVWKLMIISLVFSMFKIRLLSVHQSTNCFTSSSTGQIVVVRTETHHCSVICNLDDVIRSRCSVAVICPEQKQQWTQDAAMKEIDGKKWSWRCCFPLALTAVCWWESPAASYIWVRWVLRGLGILTGCWGMSILNAELNSTNIIRTWVFFPSRCAKLRWRAKEMMSSVEQFGQ